MWCSCKGHDESNQTVIWLLWLWHLHTERHMDWSNDLPKHRKFNTENRPILQKSEANWPPPRALNIFRFSYWHGQEILPGLYAPGLPWSDEEIVSCVPKGTKGGTNVCRPDFWNQWKTEWSPLVHSCILCNETKSLTVGKPRIKGSFCFIQAKLFWKRCWDKLFLSTSCH